MDIVALMLAFTWEEIVALLIAAGLGYLVGRLHEKFLGAKAGGPERLEWPNEDCAETGGPAIQALMEILSLAQNAPPNERSRINDLVGLCLQHDTGRYQPGQSSSPTHCGAVRNARDAARNQDWQLCIGELTHGG